MENLRAHYTPDLQKPEEQRAVTVRAFVANIDCNMAVIFEEDSDGQLDEAEIRHFKMVKED